MSTKKVFGSTSRRIKETQEFIEKINLRDETDEIMNHILKKQKEIEKEKNLIAGLYIHSNEKQALLKKYISYLNAKMYETNIDLNPNIKILSKEIQDQITELQNKMKMTISYTKKEIEQEIEEQFKEAEKNQHNKMFDLIQRGNEIIKDFNNSKFELDQIKIFFEETNLYCDKLKRLNEKLKINLDNVKSDNLNLIKKLEEVKEENEKIQFEYNEKINNNLNKELNKDLISESKSNLSSNNNNNNFYSSNSLDNLNINNNINNNNIENTNSFLYSPKNLILILKDNIKDMHKEMNEIKIKIAEEKKEKNETTQLLQKCIDDINIELHNLKKALPKINTYEYVQNAQKDNLEKILEILTYSYDNSLGNIKNKKLFISSQDFYKHYNIKKNNK